MRSAVEWNTTAARIALSVSFLVASYFVAANATEYLHNFTAASYGRFWPVRHFMFTHVVTGGLALTAGAIQFCLAALRRTSTLHRWVGRVYAGTVLVSCVASLAVLRNGSVIGPMWTLLLVTLAILALFFTVQGVIEARRRRLTQHVAWMGRSYAAMMVFAWFRLAWEVPVFEDIATGTRAAVILALTMLLTFASAEIVLRFPRQVAKTDG